MRARIANDWMLRLKQPGRFPPRLATCLARCHRHGQSRPTPLLLRHETGGYNCLHQDLYGSLAFPLQATVLLSRWGDDFTGGDFPLVEQRPRAQSRGESIALERGALAIFPNRDRPLPGATSVGVHRDEQQVADVGVVDVGAVEQFRAGTGGEDRQQRAGVVRTLAAAPSPGHASPAVQDLGDPRRVAAGPDGLPPRAAARWRPPTWRR
jgi:hypothetical protein